MLALAPYEVTAGQWRCCLHMFAYTATTTPRSVGKLIVSCRLPGRRRQGGFIEEVVGGETEEVSADRLLPTHFSANNCLVSFPWESGLVAREANRESGIENICFCETLFDKALSVVFLILPSDTLWQCFSDQGWAFFIKNGMVTYNC